MKNNKQHIKEKKMKKILECEGFANDLLDVSPDGTIKSANIVYLGPDPMEIESEIFHISITSSAMNGEHKIFDELLGKNVKVTIEIDED